MKMTIDKERIFKSKLLSKELKIIKQRGEEYLKKPIINPTYTDMKQFSLTGSRSEFENPYFDKRGRLAAFAILSYFYDDPRYLEALEDIIWSICEETTWAVTAHYGFDTDTFQIENYKNFIDLFSAETAFAFAEIYELLEDKIADTVKRRMRIEVRERTIRSYLEDVCAFRWETRTNNWAAVCGGSVGGAFLTFGTKEEIDRAIPRLLKVMEVYLSSFGEDGACVEGGGYWTYGFGYFAAFAELLRRYTDGKIDLFASEKVANIARFQQKIYMADNKIVSFSDAAQTNNHLIGLTHFVYKEYEGIEIPDDKYFSYFGGDHCYRFANILRNFAWYDDQIKTTGIKKNAYYPLPDAKWYINRRSPLALAAKGGDNGESHNHNDIGGFVLFKNGENIICDLGSGRYCRQYFNPDTRYDFLCNSSRGHSVPIINGQFQKEGEQHKGDILSYDENSFTVEFSKAYDIEELKSLVRHFEYEKKSLVITDVYDFSDKPEEITERFITLTEPNRKGNSIKIGNAVLNFDDNVEYSLSKDVHDTHRLGEIPVYLLDFKIKNPEVHTEVKFVIE